MLRVIEYFDESFKVSQGYEYAVSSYYYSIVSSLSK